MTKKRFETLVKKEGFENAMDYLKENPLITDCASLKDYAIDCIKEDNIELAVHILQAINNSPTLSIWFYYDYIAGTRCTPQSLVCIDDVENYIGFEE